MDVYLFFASNSIAIIIYIIAQIVPHWPLDNVSATILLQEVRQWTEQMKISVLFSFHSSWGESGETVHNNHYLGISYTVS